MNIDDESVTTLDDLKGDLALRYKWTPSSGNTVDRAIVEGATYAVTIEPPGGSPTGAPSGAPVFVGKLFPTGQ